MKTSKSIKHKIYKKLKKNIFYFNWQRMGNFLYQTNKNKVHIYPLKYF